MRAIKSFLLLILMIIGFLYFVPFHNITPSEWLHKDKAEEVEQQVEQVTSQPSSEPNTKQTATAVPIEGELTSWIGKNSSELEKTYGEPIRKDKSSYGYTWWIYTDHESQYAQFGVRDGKVNTVYITGSKGKIDGIALGNSYDALKKERSFQKEISFNVGVTSYRFTLTDKDLEMRPLVALSEDTFMQLYFDTFTQQLSSIRLLDANTLLMQRPYDIYYTGKLPESPILSDEEWTEIEKGAEKQIFDITNIVRKRHQLGSLAWHEEVATVAFGHSKDMSIHNYFSHYSQDGKGLKDRLSAKDVIYQMAGENIAAQYTDGPAAVEGWLNSEGHRHALLEGKYTHLGVGVYKYYYTQNFLQKADQ
ncbi:CAP domain-containing protein [Radiobacillus kanasensis]|uniref:CAP domain-containing protein n=1 Tax=Radiobacillus kanasensis TaxID=2844358 RepID=UPI001E582A94|nr:CAP domain-containing protein [Radiobacillus kanasensis]UFU00914.1 CAP domain-containing protein [Radiobacillus kanasensis]